MVAVVMRRGNITTHDNNYATKLDGKWAGDFIMVFSSGSSGGDEKRK
jgi:hypothetical protein